ncbi:MAG: hypothetical protein NWQ13_10320 [Glaciimonas sp.]|nr:hypothetical protein [Glaciimonas sp.]
MEQPLSERPEQVFFHEEYIGYKNGTLSKNRSLVSAVPIGSGAIASGRSVGTSKVIQTRIYFNSIESATLYLKNKYFIVITRNKGGSILNRSVIDTQEKAERFVDALMFFKNQ